MEQEELREQVAERYYKSLFKGELYKHETQKNCLRFANQILNIIKEAGWIDPKDFEEMASEYCRDQGWREPA